MAQLAHHNKTEAMPLSSASSTRPPEIRKDSVFNRLVIFSPARTRRPSDFKSHIPAASPNHNPIHSSCPFCLGHEHDCAPEIFRIPHGGEKWKIRVIENLYPALSRELEPSSVGVGSEGVFDERRAVIGYGFHDVVIESPFHSIHLPDLSVDEIGEVMLAYKERVRQMSQLGSLAYVQVFKNHGASAGASMTHSHSQMIGLPLVPPSVSARLNSLKEFFDKSGKCGICESQSADILIKDSNHFFAVVPFAATFPFEVWIIPREHIPYFHDMDEQKAVDLGGLLKLILLKLSKHLNDPPYNYMIHSSPFNLPASHLHSAHWFIQIVPQLNVFGGFEMGTGCFINPVFPEDAAEALRKVDCIIN